MVKLSIKDLDLKGKKALIRVDYNVPLQKNHAITDDTRIEESLPTIKYALSQGASIILMSHLGRPDGSINPDLSLSPCAMRLSNLLGTHVIMAPDCIGKETQQLINNLKPGQVILLENLRFHDEEEHPEKNPQFAKTLATYGDVYINDAFGAAHRNHSSTATICKYFPKKAAMGFLMEKELFFLHSSLDHPKHPFFAIIGGSKIDSKIHVLESLLKKADAIFIGGGMAFTFFKAQNISIGKSICDEAMINIAHDFMLKAKKCNIPVYLPLDTIAALSMEQDAKTHIFDMNQGIPAEFKGLDIGPKTLTTWEKLLIKAHTVFWNGPVGVFEMPPFAKGTFGIAKILSTLTNCITIIGGGDSVAAINQLKLGSNFSHVSTGGGASLELIEKGHLPGIDALSDK